MKTQNTSWKKTLTRDGVTYIIEVVLRGHDVCMVVQVVGATQALEYTIAPTLAGREWNTDGLRKAVTIVKTVTPAYSAKSIIRDLMDDIAVHRASSAALYMSYVCIINDLDQAIKSMSDWARG